MHVCRAEEGQPLGGRLCPDASLSGPPGTLAVSPALRPRSLPCWWLPAVPKSPLLSGQLAPRLGVSRATGEFLRCHVTDHSLRNLQMRGDKGESWAWQGTCVVIALRVLKQEDQEFEASQGCVDPVTTVSPADM